MITEKTNEKWEGNIPALEWMSIVRLRLFPSFVNLQKCTKPSNKCVVYQPNSTTHWIFSPFQSKSTTSKHWEELVSTCFHCFSLVDAGATISILTYTHTSFDFNPDSTGSSSINLVCVTWHLATENASAGNYGKYALIRTWPYEGQVDRCGSEVAKVV